MNSTTLKLTLVATAFAASFAAPVRETQAGPIIDWLFGRNQQPVYAQPIYAAPTVTTGTAVVDPCACPQPVVTNYAPQTCFRTAWVQVPVTNYRPITAVGAAGCPTTTLSPCTTYMWQARRVPAYTYRPIVTAFAAPVVAAPVAVAPGCSSCGVSTPTAAPYYAPGTTSSAFAPQTIVPGGVTSPAPLGTGVVTPADQPPSLSPGSMTPTPDPSTRNYPFDPAFGDPALSAPVSPTVPLTAPAGVKKPAVEKPLKFLPDPDAASPASEPNRAPQLLVPRDRTAFVAPRRDFAFTPIQWSSKHAVSPASAEAPLRAEPPRAVPSAETWDDTGWRSLRQ